jgi:hypothetical protein
MARIRNDVEIRSVQINNKRLRIKGRSGGELMFSLGTPNTNGLGSNRYMKTGQVLADCYRTQGIQSLDVRRYHGKKNGRITIRLRSHSDFFLKKIRLFIMSPELKLIEQGTAHMLYSNLMCSNTCRVLLHYRTKISHHYKKIKIICCEIQYLRHLHSKRY